MELPDDVGADLAGGGQDLKEIPTRRWSERVSEASRILRKHRGASVSAAWRPGELPDQLLDRLEVESEGADCSTLCAPVFVNVPGPLDSGTTLNGTLDHWRMGLRVPKHLERSSCDNHHRTEGHRDVPNGG